MTCWAGWIVAGLLGATVVLLVWCTPADPAAATPLQSRKP
jgi:hypothetical protein